MTDPVQVELSSENAFEAFYNALLDDDPEKLYDQAPCGYLSTTPDGTIIKVNQTFLTLTGFQRHDLIGRRTFAELLTMGGRIYHETHYGPMLQMQGSARGIALEIVRADRERLPVLVNSVMASDANGHPLVIRTAIFDATERREYERELLRAKQRAEESEVQARELARTLQQTLIPPATPHVPGLDVAAVYRPASSSSGVDVGGDFFDIFQIGAGDWVFVVGDVCGKGVEAAVVTALARYTLRAAAVRERQPSQALETLNEILLRSDTERFCTAQFHRARQVKGSWTVTTSSGGHPLPYLLRPGSRPTTFGRYGSLVGVLDKPTFYDTEISLAAGDAVILYTDGVTEARSCTDFYGDDRLAATITANGASATSLVGGILRDVLAFQNGDPRDDIAVVAIRLP